MKLSASSPKRRGRPKAGLTRAAVVAAAAEIADRGGPGALTLAALAARLGIKPPSLFNHIDGLASLRRELAILALRELGDTLGNSAIGKSRDDAVRALAAEYRNFARRHPGIYAETLAAVDPKDREMNALSDRILEICVKILSGYGLDRRASLHAIRALRSIVHGFSSLEGAHGFGIPMSIDESFAWLIDTFIAGLKSADTGRLRGRNPV
ncbi:MAG: TetR-like C-terminal domain-containing protein [Candidatus Binataceae bacterium]